MTRLDPSARGDGDDVRQSRYLGAQERALAADLIAVLPASGSAALTWASLDLRPSAEHVLYAALRRPSVGRVPDRLGVVRPFARLVREAVPMVRHVAERQSAPVDIVALVSHPVHASLFEPIRAHLGSRASVLTVDASTNRRHSDPIRGAARLTAHLEPGLAPSLASHAVAVDRQFREAPAGWIGLLEPDRAEHLVGLLRRGLPLIALDAARLLTLLRRRRPALVACFNESGILARIVPAAARHIDARIRVVDLPHAEAADPWGTAGTSYDAVAVYGPRAAQAMETAGIPAERIVQIGPLRYDALLTRPPQPPGESPRRVVLAAQPADPTKPAFSAAVKREVLLAAIAASAELRPAELLIVPHPTETDGVTREVLAETSIPAGVDVRSLSAGTLHEALAGAWLLVTGASQAVFEAVVSGVPAITINATGAEDPVTFAREGLALGATSIAETAHLAQGLLEPARRMEAIATAREALGDRLGPLDGQAAARAAEWLLDFVDERS
jgi:hypothetical protein